MGKSETIAANYEEISARIAAAGGAGRTAIVAVSKTQGVDVIRAARQCGIVDFGENYARELIDKAVVFEQPQLRWHMIGALQSRTIAPLGPHVALWHTVSRAKEIELLARVRSGTRILIQVDFSGVAGRNGAALNQVASLVEYGREYGLDVAGLMVVTPLVGLSERAKIFGKTYRLGTSLGLKEFSMGMSDDYEPAVQEGSTIVRIGRAIFGERQS